VVDRKERAPSELQLTEHDAALVETLAGVWQNDTTGDRAFGGLGGWLYSEGVSWERAEAIAEHLAAAVRSTHPNPVGRVAQAYDGRCPLGWTAMREALEENGAKVDTMTLAGAQMAARALVRKSVDPPKESEPAASVEPAPGAEPEPAQIVEANRVRAKIVDLAGPCSEKLETPPWVCAGLALARGVRPATLIGYAGVGKTTALSSIAVAVATGRKALGFAPCEKGRVLIIDHEDEFGYKRSIQELAKADSIDPPSIDYLDGEITLRDEKKLLVLPHLFEEYDLVICDSLGAMNAGLDENSTTYADVFRTLYHWCKICRPGGTCLLFARHSGKSQREGAMAGRGSSAIDGWTSTQWLLQRQDQDNWGAGVHWSCLRANGVNLRTPPKPFVSTFDPVKGYAAAFEEGVSKRGDAVAKQRVLEFLTRARREQPDRWWLKGEIRDYAKGKATVVSDAISALLNDGSILRNHSGSGYKAR
jgi:hypothetical protein